MSDALEFLRGVINDATIPLTFTIRVTPKAKRECIKVVEEGSPRVYKVYVTAVPEDGKANKAVIALLSKELKVAKSRISIKQGATSRDKIVEICG